MFQKDIVIDGIHAEKLYEINLLKNIDEEKFFPRYIDIYMIAPLIGALYGKKEEYCKADVSPRNILADTVIRNQAQLKMIYNLIMLFDQREELSMEDRVYRAFRDDANREYNDNHKNNFELFNMYLRGGITILHEKVTKDEDSLEGFLANYRDFITEYKNDFIDQKDYSEFQID